MLPEIVRNPLLDHLERVKKIHARDLTDGYGRVLMPNAIDRKFPNALAEWGWQCVFPQENHWKNDKTGEQGRHHTEESLVHCCEGWIDKASDVSYVPAFFCHASAGGWL